MILRVKTGVVEFSCPTCQLPQMLPPELLSRARPQFPQSQQQPPPPIQTLPPPIQQQLKPLNLPRPPVPAHGIDPTKMQLPCANCQAILNVPHGLTRFSCPQCHVELAVDVSKLNRSLTAPQSHPNPPTPDAPPVPPPPPPEEVNEVFSPINLIVILNYAVISLCCWLFYAWVNQWCFNSSFG